MATLDNNLRRQLERTVVSARNTAESAAEKALRRLGMHQHEPPTTLSSEERGFRRELEAQKTQLPGYRALVEQCAYEHWHRILFARFLAENELLIHPTAEVAVSLEDCEDEELQREFGAADAYDLAARYAAHMLPAVFRPDDALLRVKLAPEDRLTLENLVKSLPEVVFRADDSLGWTYQFWQKERKDEVNKAEEAVQGSDISAVTQLFTEHYMVRFLLENTLGAWWVHHRPETTLKRGWDYFKPDIPHDFKSFPEKLEEITFLDPCCGSGHFLVEAFLLFQAMYREQGMSPAHAGDAAIANNVCGLELDPRCTQIAAFNLAFAAWRHGGFRPLPEIQVACSGLPLKGARPTWERLAGQNAALRAGMSLLHATFSNAGDLGSLIHPPRAFEVKSGAQLRQFTLEGMHETERQQELELAASVKWDELEPLLNKALSSDENRETYFAGVRAQGIAKAAQMLSDRYWFAVTNPPFLNVAKAGSQLQEFCKENHPEAKKDLATCFIERLRSFAKPDGVYALVTPQNWLFQGNDKSFRIKMLKQQRWIAVVRYGPGAFESISGEVMQAANLVFANRSPALPDVFFGFDASSYKGALEKAGRLRLCSVREQSEPTGVLLNQLEELKNPDSRILLEASWTSHPLLSSYTNSYWGIGSGDSERFARKYWEIPTMSDDWEFLQVTFTATAAHTGREEILYWQKGAGKLYEMAEELKDRLKNIWRRGHEAWGKPGVVISQMGGLVASLYSGEIFQNGTAAIIPKDPEHLPAVWCFCSSPEFNRTVRKIDQSLCVTNATLIKVPFDLERWQRTADERYPNGLPDPHSDDPTQWLFRGDIPSSVEPLQVAMVRLLGYRWPDQPDDHLDRLTDDDGIVTLAALVNQEGLANRLRTLLREAYESDAPQRPKGAPTVNEPREWNETVIPRLLVRAGAPGIMLEEWLRDRFFDAHTKLFQQRPFLWHIWDGRKDGFHAFVNYHKLDRKNLERLTHVYLGEWIERQKAASDSGDRTADGRLAAAQELQRKLELIRLGEPPYDIFVRWKTLHEQPIGWDPDLNDGVRMNIRPFIEAGILHGKVNVNWNKDRGKDPKPNISGTAERHNDLHFTLAQKRAARAEKAN